MDKIANFLEEFACGFASVATIVSAIAYYDSEYKSAACNIAAQNSIDNAPRITFGPLIIRFLITRSAMEATSNGRTQTMIYKVLTMLCGSITLMTFYAVGKKWLTRFRPKRVQRRLQIERTNNIDRHHDAKICVVCQENPREVALFPCGHVCVCGDCSLMINEICPICRGPVGEIVTIYLS